MTKQLRETALETLRTATPTTERWTAAKYLEVSQPNDGNLIEVLGGELIMAASPMPIHQKVVFRVAKLLDAFVGPRKLGEVYIAPMDVVLGDDLAEPDVLFVSTARKDIIKRERIVGAPDLVVEVLSLSTSQRDLRYKWDLYARSGVREYWVVNPEAETVEVLMLAENEYKRHALAEKEVDVTSTVLDGFSVAAKELFAE
ncbi:MAG TPA: Uma2 family endonuclease [Anaerolineales bacterium]|nr:Uma2 family endonuclease [Anaerolineales bacterium]